MANNLLDAIKQNTQSAGMQQQGDTDQTNTLQGLLRAKSGKAVSGGATNASNLGEQQAVNSTNNTMQNQVLPAATTQAAGQATQSAGIQQQGQIQQQQIAQQRTADTLQTRLKTNQMLSDLERNKGKVDADQQSAQVSQVAQNLRLQTQQYTDDLQREGQTARLDNQSEFDQQLEASVLGANKDLLQQKLGDRSILDSNDQDFAKQVAQIDIDSAYDIFKNQQAEAKQRALYQGIGALATAGVGAAGSKGSPSSGGPSSSGGSDVGMTDSSSASAYGEGTAIA